MKKQLWLILIAVECFDYCLQCFWLISALYTLLLHRFHRRALYCI